jgi:hypothetical protein
MGFRFRKSINLGGGFRINLSKNGVGYSWGIPGYRITKTANGKTRTTASIPGTGISYIEEHGKKNNNNFENIPVENINSGVSDYKEINTADISNFRTAEYKEILDSVEKAIGYNAITTLLLILSIIFFQVGLIFTIPLKFYVKKRYKVKLNYNFEDNTYELFEKKLKTWKLLNNSIKKWQIISQAKVINKKINSGSSTSVFRSEFSISNKLPWYIETNISPIVIKLKKEEFIILPDKILIIKNKKLGIANYKNISVNYSLVKFVESEIVPSDSEIIDYTWQYVNKNGGPDKRYKGNKRLPICKYGEIDITSNDGINIKLNLSNNNTAIEFYKKSNED